MGKQRDIGMVETKNDMKPCSSCAVACVNCYWYRRCRDKPYGYCMLEPPKTTGRKRPEVGEGDRCRHFDAGNRRRKNTDQIERTRLEEEK